MAEGFERWNTDPAAAHAEARRRLAEAVNHGRLSLAGLGALDRLPEGLEYRLDIVEVDLRDTGIADLAALRGLPWLQDLTLIRTPATDIAPLAGLTALQELSLDDTQVADLAPLAGLTALQTLSLVGTQVSDLAPLARLTALQTLWLHGTQVADLAPLAGLTALQWLSLDRTQVADLAPLAGLTALQWLSLDGTLVANLAPLAGLTALQWLSLDGTQVADLAPLAGLTALQRLSLDRTQVADLAPLAGLTALQTLGLDGTPVADLLPLAGLARLREAAERQEPSSGLSFAGTPAADRDDAHRHLAALEGEPCAIETLQYLNGVHPTLSGPPAPWRPQPPRPPLPDPYDFAAQNPAGWQFEMSGALLAIDTAATPPAAAGQLLPRLRARLDELNRAYAGANHGTPLQVRQDAAAMAAIADGDLEQVAGRALVLWDLSVGLAHHLEQDRRAGIEGRDPLDRLGAERAGALERLVWVAAPFVRMFPEACALDDSTGGYLRTTFDARRSIALVEQAMAARVLERASGELIRALARIAAEQGAQADKARSVTATGERNMLGILAHYAGQTARALGKGTLALGAAAAMGGAAKVGGDLADEWQLGIGAAHLLREARGAIEEILPDLPPDLAASLRDALVAVEAVDLPPLPSPRPLAPGASPEPSARPAAPGSAPSPPRPKR